MPNSSDEQTDQLAQWFHKLIEILRSYQDSTWLALVQAANEKSAIIGIDEVFLSLKAKGNLNLKVTIEKVPKVDFPHFYCPGEVLRKIINGQSTLDDAIHRGSLFVKGKLQDLLAVNNLVMNLLADGAVKRELLLLWQEFDEHWPANGKKKCYCLEDQIPVYGIFINQISNEILNY